MKYLCLAYGKEDAWSALSKSEQETLLAEDQVLLRRGDLVRVVGEPTTVRSWEGAPPITKGPFVALPAPMAGFSIIEAKDLEEAIELVKGTPCAVAGGAIEIRRIVEP